ncbi:MAG: hypothetical protein WDM86_12595 [Rhizomicrobium sp.]
MRYSWKGYWGAASAAIGILLLGLFVIAHAMPPGVSWSKAAAFAILTMGCASLGFVAYRYADEVMLQTHKTAWFWGSLGAVVAMVPAMIVLSWHLVPFPLLPARLDHPQIYFVLGMECLLVAQLMGFLAVGAYRRWLG